MGSLDKMAFKPFTYIKAGWKKEIRDKKRKRKKKTGKREKIIMTKKPCMWAGWKKEKKEKKTCNNLSYDWIKPY